MRSYYSSNINKHLNKKKRQTEYTAYKGHTLGGKKEKKREKEKKKKKMTLLVPRWLH